MADNSRTPSSQDLSLYNLLESQAERAPDAIAIVAPGRTPLTYGRLRIFVGHVVEALNTIGLGRNDRVALVLPDGPEMAVAFLAIAAGATCAPLNPAYQANEFDFYLTDLQVKALVLPAGSDSPARAVAHKRGIAILECAPVFAAEAGIFTLRGDARSHVVGATGQTLRPSFAQPDDVALALHTSGTTSRPKLVPLTHTNICTSARNIHAALALTAEDRCLNVMPLFHIHGLIGATLASLAAGASVVCTSGFDVTMFFAWMEAFHPTWYTAVPTMHQAIVARAESNHEVIARWPLRFIRSSSSALPPQVMARLERVFQAPVIEAYGMTEASHQMASNPLPPRVRKAGSVGVAAGPEIAIMDDTGNLLPPGQKGEIVIRGANVTRGYENHPAANASAFTHGWFRTGDQGFFDGDQYLFITGRLKEIISRGGEKISPREVDEVLMEHPAVVQAVTFALPDAHLGEEVGAAVVLRHPGAVTERGLQTFAAQRVAAFKVPRRIVFLDAIPKGPTGKLQRLGLAATLGLTGALAPSHATEAALMQPDAVSVRRGGLEMERTGAAPRTPLEEQLARLWVAVLKVDRVGVQDNFFDLGGSSLQAVQLFERIEKTLGHHFPLATLYQAPTIAELAELIERDELPQASLLLPLRTTGSKPPFFSVHFGDHRLLQHCPDMDQPWYGLYMASLEGRRDPERMEVMATDYIRQMRTLQPEGPYFLGGYCFGAVLAFEIAQQLYAQGQRVALLLLVEPVSLGSEDRRDWGWRTRLRECGRQWREDIETFVGELYLARGGRIPSSCRRGYRRGIQRRARRAYVPQMYPGRVTLLHTPQRSAWMQHDWQGLAGGGLEVLGIPGNHFSLFSGSNTEPFLHQVLDCLQRTQAREDREPMMHQLARNLE
jgi:acyl-CoA synthetase (AMP-forming)/AMP-acid ligase II/thioesterase domain-containing protein/acyl carrier protein